ncbi:hypothetical protein ACFL4P_02270 [Gemmatimonadota bacterium]
MSEPPASLTCRGFFLMYSDYGTFYNRKEFFAACCGDSQFTGMSLFLSVFLLGCGIFGWVSSIINGIKANLEKNFPREEKFTGIGRGFTASNLQAILEAEMPR